MAWKMRIEIFGEEEADDGRGGRTRIDLTERGAFAAKAEYFDSDKPTVILHRHSFNFGAGTDWEKALTLMQEAGRRVRDAREQVESGRERVDGMEFPVD